MIFQIAVTLFALLFTASALHSTLQSHASRSSRNDCKQISSVKIRAMPKHIAFIVDGNGRWAQKRGRQRIDGHTVGANVTVDIVKKAFEIGVEYITLYLFSTENWNRPSHEVENIMSLLEKYLIDFSSYLKENKIRLKTIGQTHRLPNSLRQLFNHLGNSGPHDGIAQQRTLCLAISYGGRDDIVQACVELAQAVKRESISSDMITEELFAKYTSTGRLGIPDPDLIIRTSGESRISNFLLWQCAYAEFAIVDKLCKSKGWHVSMSHSILWERWS